MRERRVVYPVVQQERGVKRGTSIQDKEGGVYESPRARKSRGGQQGRPRNMKSRGAHIERAPTRKVSGPVSALLSHNIEESICTAGVCWLGSWRARRVNGAPARNR